MTYLTVSRTQQLYLGLVLLVVLPVILALVFQQQLYNFYLAQFVRPGLEREFGFTAGTIPSPLECCPNNRYFAIVAVTPGGVLAKAGIREGDLPVGYVHGAETGFYQALLEARLGQPVQITVLSAGDYDKDWKAWHKVRIEKPR